MTETSFLAPYKHKFLLAGVQKTRATLCSSDLTGSYGGGMRLMLAEDSSANKLAVRQHPIIMGERHYEINSYLCYDMLVNTYLAL